MGRYSDKDIRSVTVRHVSGTVLAVVVSLFCLFGLTLADPTNVPGATISNHANYSHATNATITIEKLSCRPCGECDSKTGSIVGGVIGGAVAGVIVTLAVMMCLRNRSLSPPPKDYNEEEDKAHFDVNRNSGEDVVLGQKDVETGSDRDSVKQHKKLERLVQRNLPNKPGADLKSEAAAVPLIHNADTETDANTNSTDDANNSSRYVAPDFPNEDRSHSHSQPNYLNVGRGGLLEQPYDQLEMVPEEVEYENQPMNVYEPLKES